MKEPLTNNKTNLNNIKINVGVNSNEATITTNFTDNDNLINAIYNIGSVELTNVSYYGFNNYMNTGNSPVTPVIGAANSQNGALVYQDNHEAGQYITIEIYDSSNNIIKTYTNKTGIYGNITLDVNNLDIGEYSVIAYHISDEYYSSIYNSTTFTITTLKTNTTLNVNTTSIYIGDKVMITPVVKQVALQLQVVILKFMMAIH